MAGPGEGGCAASCGVYLEGNGSIPILLGVGLAVEDDDHNTVFLMQVRAQTWLLGLASSSLCICLCIMCVFPAESCD